MKEGWEIKTLGEVCEYHKEQGVYNDLPYVGMEFIDSGTGKLLNTVDSSLMKSTSFRFNRGEVLYGRLRPYLKKAFVAEFEGCCSTEVFPIQPNADELHPRFLLLWLLSDKITNLMEKTCAGCRMPRANMKEALKFHIPLPPLPEQQRIVEVLDREFERIDTIRNNAETSLQYAKDLMQAKLKEELQHKEGWERKKLGDLCVLKSGNSNANNSGEGDLPYVKVGDMNLPDNDTFITTSSTFVDRESNLKGIFPINSIIFPKRGGAIYTNKKRLTKVEICCDLNIMGIYSKGEVLPEYLFHWIKFLDFGEICNGAAIPQLNNIDIAPLEIIIPPLPEQQQIVTRLDKCSESCRKIEENCKAIMEHCDALKQALLRKAFDGEL